MRVKPKALHQNGICEDKWKGTKVEKTQRWIYG